jgi:hypothetical protein
VVGARIGSRMGCAQDHVLCRTTWTASAAGSHAHAVSACEHVAHVAWFMEQLAALHLECICGQHRTDGFHRGILVAVPRGEQFVEVLQSSQRSKDGARNRGSARSKDKEAALETTPMHEDAAESGALAAVHAECRGRA